ncbi:hypothetical protein FSARC_13831 [Fusarium sarcochroum]|uniref:Tryptophan synthase beta chain-like PALP domain-containing protein n=1 Tax=Fusarium sarcochroum TaxID=1208366 RepID=A0A8H4SYM7_9HYPO|nr:hypothetical protein FSARC_13831 [Fusarium sarcochroum]
MVSPRSSARGILDAIGNTPCVELVRVVPEGHARVFIKLEGLNPTGSYKDRMALSVIEQAEKRGDIQRDTTVIEATGGSTGSSLAFICAVRGYSFKAVSSDAFAAEKLRTMTSLGSSLDLVHSPTGKITPDLIPSMRDRAECLAASGNFYWADQFNNQDVLVGYEGLGRELVAQLPRGIDGFCGAVGGGGMVMGVSKILKAAWPQVRVVILEPESAPILTKGHGGPHGVEGIGIGIVPPLLNPLYFDEARSICEAQARDMCRRLAKEEGILAGTSTGLNVVAAIEMAKELGPGKTVVTIACDTGLKYMSGTLFE